MANVTQKAFLKDAEIAELTDTLQVDLQDLINTIIIDAGSTEGHSAEDIFLYSIEQAFRRGYMTGLYDYNETVKTVFDDAARAVL